MAPPGRAAWLLSSSLLAGWSLPALAPVAAPVAATLRIPRRREESAGVVITFDDGPDQGGTPAVLEALAAADARAVFFCVGEQVEANPSVLREVVSCGHLVGVHGQRHRNQLRLTGRQSREDLARANAVISEVAGMAPAFHRPPYGIYSWPGFAAVKRAGMEPLLWSRWGHDWRGSRDPAAITAEVTRNLGPGDVLLLHDADHYSASGCWRNTVAALPAILEKIDRAGLSAVLPGDAQTRSGAAPEAI